MTRSATERPRALPTNRTRRPRRVAYTQALGLERHRAHAKRGITTRTLALVWVVLTWPGSGRPYHVRVLDDPLLAARLGRPRRPAPNTRSRSLAAFPARAVRAAVEASYLAELPRQAGRV